MTSLTYEKTLKFAREELPNLFAEFIFPLDFKVKWSDFINKRLENYLVTDLFLADICPNKLSKLENKYYEKRKKQITQVITPILINDSFIKDIIDFSESCALDKFAYGRKSKEDTKPLKDSFKDINFNKMEFAWHALEMDMSDKYRKKINDIFDKYNSNYHGESIEDLSNLITIIHDAYSDTPLEKRLNDLDLIIKKYGLSDLWRRPIKWLTLTGHFFLPRTLFNIRVDSKENNYEMSIMLYPETQFNDLQLGRKKIEQIKKEIYGKSRMKSSKNIDYAINVLNSMDKHDCNLINALQNESALCSDDDDINKQYQTAQKRMYRFKKSSTFKSQPPNRVKALENKVGTTGSIYYF